MVTPLELLQAIGVLAHIRAVDKDMGMDIDEPGDHQPIFGADRLARSRLAQRRGDFDDFATGNSDAAQTGVRGATRFLVPWRVETAIARCPAKQRSSRRVARRYRCDPMEATSIGPQRSFHGVVDNLDVSSVAEQVSAEHANCRCDGGGSLIREDT